MSTARKLAVPNAYPPANIGTADAPSITPSATRPHITEQQEIRRRQILSTAAQFFLTKSYVGMTTNDLCNTLGVTKSVVYYYFTDKCEIFDVLYHGVAQICLLVIHETTNLALSVQRCLQACLLEIACRCIDCHYAVTPMYHDRQYPHPEAVE